jgi:TetR/AcrR family transcriptional regulator
MSNRENLLDGALKSFAARGYDAVGVQEIAEVAGIQKPTLYHYFGSKSGLLETLLSESFNPFLEELQGVADYKGDLTTTLRAVVNTYFNFAQRKPELYRLYLSLWFAPPDSEAFKVSLRFVEQQQHYMETLFLSASNDHGNMKGRQRVYAASFLGMINTYVMLSLNGYAICDEKLAQSMLHQFMHGIFS